jgi:hypothetical protein
VLLLLDAFIGMSPVPCGAGHPATYQSDITLKKSCRALRGVPRSLDHSFAIEPGDSSLPEPPITGKAMGDAPQQEVLERTL